MLGCEVTNLYVHFSSHQANFALRYKAGVTQDRPLWKSSEYQKQFQWKKGMKASPLLAAQEVCEPLWDSTFGLFLFACLFCGIERLPV